MAIHSYEEAGVSIEKGDAFAQFIASQQSTAISKALGGFAGGIPIPQAKTMEEPILLSTTDGVGTKLLVARKLEKYDTLGQDLVAMCVNDLVVCGAMPLGFLDYIATSAIDESVLHPLMKGIIAACEASDCSLLGGETAEMPDLYSPGDFDLAGFALGVVDKPSMLPKIDSIVEGDLVLGLASNGIHSNGLSLARKALEGSDRDTWEQLLVPTELYVRSFMRLMESVPIKAGAHITGGGLEANLQRVLPEQLRLNCSWSWDVPEIFEKIQHRGGIAIDEMRKVFNMGVGLAFVVSPEDLGAVEEQAHTLDQKLVSIGTLIRG